MTGFKERIARLPPEARAALERRLQEASHEATEPIPRRNGDGPAPLSFAQQRLWLLDRLDPGKATYNIPRAFRLRGPLDVKALGRALEAMQERHEVLRTTFVMEGGGPVRSVVAPRPSALSVVEVAGFAEGAREAEALRVVEQDAGSPFDLARGPLLRATLLRLDAGEYILLVNVHHIVFDGWSVQVFYQELGALYEAYRDGRSPRLPALPIQYADFAVWQLEWLRGRVLEEQLSYWKRRLEGSPAALELSASRTRPSVQTFRGAAESVSISRPVAEAIRSLGQREGATLFMTLLAAFQVLLLRHSGQEDILVGSPVAGRNRSEIEGLVGFFINTLVFRGDLSGDPTFRELLGRVREASIDAYAHQDLPFERLVEELNPDRTLSHSPLFQVMMLLRNGFGASLALPGLSVTPLPLEVTTAKFDLTASFQDMGTEIAVSFQYNTDLLDASMIRWMLGHFRTLLDSIASHPDRRLSRFMVRTESERLAASSRRNEVRPCNPFLEFREEEIEQSITNRFEQQARRHSSRTAVITTNHRWTYQRLAHEADRVARVILEASRGSPERVALLFEQDALMIAAILGSLKAGKTYVPLDASYPADRLNYMLQDSGAAVVLTNDLNLKLANELGAGRCTVANLDRMTASSSASIPPPQIGPQTLAYVLYTSGSTGRPKGVVQNHRNVLHFIRAYTNSLHIRAEDRLSLLSSYSFDAAVMDIFGALLNGSTLCLRNLKAQGTAGMAQWLAEEEITVLHAVPTIFRTFAQALNEQQIFSKVRLVVLGGEEVHRGDVELYRRNFSPDCLLVNGLGPTESTVTLQYFLDHTTEIHHRVPVGYPVDDTEILLLDSEGQTTELYGEIGIRSPYLALGYWNKPQLTRAAFLPDPEGGTRRIYRTGDLGTLLPDGAIQFLGRKASVVKIRGHRIETSEIEYVLLQHPQVHACAVQAMQEDSGDTRLVGYIVSGDGTSPRVSELRKLLKGMLPEFMVPATFVFLDELPLTPTGKVDRRALPLPTSERPKLADPYMAPRNAAEEKLIQIWEELVQVDRIGVHDNFFDLGGHSLLAVALVARIEKEFGRDLALATIFRAPTVAELARMFQERRRPGRRTPSLVAIKPSGTRPPFFCVHAKTGIVHYRSLARMLGPDQPFYGLQSQGLDGARAPYETVEEMAAHYVREMRGVQPEGPYYLGGYSFGGKVAFEMARQLRAQGQRTAFLAFFDTLNIPLTPRPTRLEHARQRTRVHIAALKTVGTRARLSYLMQRAETLRSVAGRALSRGYEALFRPLRGAQRRVLDVNTRAARRYIPGFYEGRATIFRATDRTEDWRDRLRPYPHLGWERLCGEGVEIVEVPGGHSSLFEEEANVRALGERLAECLRAAQDTGMAAPITASR